MTPTPLGESSGPRGTSLWLDGRERLADDPWPDEPVDDVVVGAGLTGLTTALLLARSGRRVAVVEARYVGAVATGNTTAKVSVLQGTKLSRILSLQSERVARAYVESNLEGQAWLARFCDDHAIATQRCDAVTYAATPHQVRAVEQEAAAARSLDLDVREVDALDVPFELHRAVVLPDQLQLDPMDVLDALVSELRRHGGSLHQDSRVATVRGRRRPSVAVQGRPPLEPENVVLATGTPILDRGLSFATLEPMRSYALAFDGATAPDGMYLSAGTPSRSVRWTPGGSSGTRLLVGGAGHDVGRTRSEAAHVDELRAWTARTFPGAVETHAWSAQDYRSHDGVPYVGRLPGGAGRIHVATGFDKWGMTNGVAAGLRLAGGILGSTSPDAATLGQRTTGPRAAARVVATNVKVAAAGVRGVARAALGRAAATPEEGRGHVGRRGVVPVATSTVGGRTCEVVGVCTHLGGVVHWNDQERSWDCPLHGSRFAPDGSVLEGPATRPLRPADSSAD